MFTLYSFLLTFTLIGFKLASLPADSEHPFGHERIEYISGMIVSILILLIGGYFIYDIFFDKKLVNLFKKLLFYSKISI